MKKKGRGSPKKRKHVKTFEDHCPFWLFTLFVVAWSGVFFLVVALFYVALLKPAYQFIPLATNAPPTHSPQVDRGMQLIDEMMDDEATPSGVKIESCQPAVENDGVRQLILDRANEYSETIRQMGTWCRLSNGREFVTYTENARVPDSERLYLQQVIAQVYRDEGGLGDFVGPEDSFYCRTSPRGEPADIVNAKGGGVELRCTYEENGEEIHRYLALDEYGRIQGDGTDDARNLIGIRPGIGDFARDYCVINSEGNICLLRNGDWVLASVDDSDTLSVSRSADSSDLSGMKFIAMNHDLRIISTDGSYADVFYGWGSEACHYETINRVNLRTYEQEELFRFTDCPSN